MIFCHSSNDMLLLKCIYFSFLRCLDCFSSISFRADTEIIYSKNLNNKKKINSCMIFSEKSPKQDLTMACSFKLYIDGQGAGWFIRMDAPFLIRKVFLVSGDKGKRKDHSYFWVLIPNKMLLLARALTDADNKRH